MNTTLHHEESGFGTIETILVIIIVGIIGFTGWFVWDSSQKTSDSLNSTVKSTEASATAKKSSATPTPKSAAATGKYLELPEWGVKFKLSANIEDAYYDKSASVSENNGFNLRVHSLDAENDCKTGSASVASIARVDKSVTTENTA